MKKTRILVVTIMALALCFGLLTLSLASEPEPIVEAAITKLLQVPEGTEPPPMDFIFTVTPFSYNGSEEAADVARLPVIGAEGKVTISFGGFGVGPEVLDGTANSVSTYYLESAELFSNIPWPNAGIYEYYIGETDSTYAIASPLHEALTLSSARYRIAVEVREDDDGKPYIWNIGTVRIIREDGTPGTDKVDPTPGGPIGSEFNYSQMTFTNKYVKTNGTADPGDPDDPDDPGNPDPTDPAESTLNISKEVTGEVGSLTMPFNFALTINVPNLIPGYVIGHGYKAYIVEGDDVIGNPITFLTGTANTFRLTHGQKLVFINTPVGTTYSVTETAEPGYTTTVAIRNNNVLGAAVASLTASGFAGELLNGVYFVNDNPYTPPTGLNIDNLPFYGLILLAVGGLVIFIVVKARKRSKG